MSSIIPGTTTEAPLGDQFVICTVEQMCFEPLMKGASEGSGSDFEWHAVPGCRGGNAEGPRSGGSFRLIKNNVLLIYE